MKTANGIKKINPVRDSKNKRKAQSKQISNGVKCPIFQSKNESIERITQAINEAKESREKAILAKKLLKEVEGLLSCEHFSEERAECKVCQYISKIRRRTANLILKINTKRLKMKN